MEHIVALSGGKDSTALALLLNEREPRDYTYVITPTGNELPEMYAHWRKLSEMLGSQLRPVHGNMGLLEMIRAEGMIPNHRARWCTRKLKLEPYYRWLSTLGPCVSYVGLRADEESRPGMIFPDVGEVQMRFPLREWGMTEADVLSVLDERGVSIPDRTDCAVCFWQKIGEWYLLWRDHPDMYAEGEALEAAIGDGTFTFRSPQRDTWPASLRELRLRFEAGDVPERSLKMMDKRRGIGACRVCTL